MSPQDTALPTPRDIQLLVEVAGSTLDYDRTTKAKLYSRAGIQEYWVADLPRRRLWIHRGPNGDMYDSVESFSENDTVAPIAAASYLIRIGDLFE